MQYGVSCLPIRMCWTEVSCEWFPIIQDHVEGYLELAAKTKAYFVAAVSMWDAEYYIKVDDDVHVNIGVQIIIITLWSQGLQQCGSMTTGS